MLKQWHQKMGAGLKDMIGSAMKGDKVNGSKSPLKKIDSARAKKIQADIAAAKARGVKGDGLSEEKKAKFKDDVSKIRRDRRAAEVEKRFGKNAQSRFGNREI